ncbi:MAG: 2-amino-4-hydroxy-6-hydroxymethyldihydropteridine diphosphokinase [Planctomycetota bacterium]|jgi:2-amino-4-hydroxy-6-hydroxymethyldihydropteridine diphosphokinase
MAQTTAYVGLGSNLGDRRSKIDGALGMLAQARHIELGPVSGVVETEPLGQADQPTYMNAVAELRTTLTAEDLHRTLADIETSLGRVRQGKWASRTIDLDLLLFGRDIIDTPELTIPHPRLHLRSFVLKGLCELDGNLIHPLLKETVSELARRLCGSDFVLNSHVPQLVSIAGNIGVGKTTLARKLAAALGSEVLFEAYDTNPFLPEVYAGRNELALDSQLYFLTTRIRQLDPAVLARGQIYFADYVFDKELIYARRLLDGQQFALYENIYHLVEERAVAPVLVMYMDDSPQNCLERIHSRNRPYEQQIRLPFLEMLGGDYQRLFSDWRTCPVIRVPRAEDADVEHLANQVKYYTADHSGVAGSKA